MSFADYILTENLEPQRQRLLTHPFWTGIEDGTLPRVMLRAFALQDWWLVREAYCLDALAVAGMSDLHLQELLFAKLVSKIGGYTLLLLFGEALDLSRADFDAVEPLAGCMALTTFFTWMLAYGSVPEKIAVMSHGWKRIALQRKEIVRFPATPLSTNFEFKGLWTTVCLRSKSDEIIQHNLHQSPRQRL
jgi:pyrroloquinoline-quinone synthase